MNWWPDPDESPVQLSETKRLFIELRFNPADYIKEVLISPHGDTVDSQNAAESMGASLGLNYDVKLSSVPFRT